jgi:hypothetical protein
LDANLISRSHNEVCWNQQGSSTAPSSCSNPGTMDRKVK